MMKKSILWIRMLKSQSRRNRKLLKLRIRNSSASITTRWSVSHCTLMQILRHYGSCIYFRSIIIQRFSDGLLCWFKGWALLSTRVTLLWTFQWRISLKEFHSKIQNQKLQSKRQSKLEMQMWLLRLIRRDLISLKSSSSISILKGRKRSMWRKESH